MNAISTESVITGVVLLWNVICFFHMGFDKRRAKKQKSRVRERTLILCCLCFGAAGGYLGMRAFHHKTKKRPFPWLIPLLMVLQLCFYGYVLIRFVI